MSFVGDRSELGIWALRDGRDIKPHKRLHLAGAEFMDPEDWSAHAITEQDGKGTAGDIHPWTFWQGQRREIGSWQNMFGSVIVSNGGDYGGRGGRFGGGGPGLSRPGDTGPGPGRRYASDPSSMKAQPIRRRDYLQDTRYAQWDEGQPSHLPLYPGGYRVVATSGTDERSQQNLLLPADGRIVCPQAWGPDRMGTTVCDMVSPGQLNQGGEYGLAGRDAPVQTIAWVVRLPKLAKPTSKAGNAVAINGTLTSQGGMAGYIPVVAKTKIGNQEKNGGQGDGPEDSKRPPVVSGAPQPADPASPPGGGTTPSTSTPAGGKADKAPAVAPTTVAFMSQEASGPWSVGYKEDKHHLGMTLDDQPMNSGHLHIDTYFEVDDNMDGPHEHTLEDYPKVKKIGYPWVTQLMWDKAEPHNWVGGPAFGKWRRVTFVPLIPGKGPRRRPPPPDDDTPDVPGDIPPWEKDPDPPYKPPTTGDTSTPGGGGDDVAAAFDWSDYSDEAYDRRHEPGDYRPNDPTYDHPWGGPLGSPPKPPPPYKQGPGDYRPGVDPHPWGHGRDPKLPLSEGRNGQPGYRPGEDPHPWGEGRDPSTPLSEGRNGQPGYRPGDPGNPDPFGEGRDPATPLSEGRNGQPGYRPGESPHPWKDEFGNPGGFKKGIVQVSTLSTGADAVINAPYLMGLGSVLSRAQHITIGSLDFRYATHPFELARDQLAYVPAVMRTESIADELGVVDWRYTQRPEHSRVSGGTSSGGTWHMPPEYDIVDYRAGAPRTIDGGISTSYRGVTPGVHWAAGYPSAAQGVVDGGWRWGYDAASGDLQFDNVASAAWSNVLALGSAGIKAVQPIYLTERAAAAADTAGLGQVWVKTGTPNTLWFTDDAGTDFQLGAGGGGLSDIVDDVTPQLGATLDGQGNHLQNMGVLMLVERASAIADVAGHGQLWVKTATPNELWFTDDAGTDSTIALLNGAAGQAFANKVVFDGEIEVDGDFNHDGTNFGFFGTTPVGQQTTSVSQSTSVSLSDGGETVARAQIEGLLNSLGTAVNALKTALDNLGATA
jgi:hypothetical protein